jgi:hexokinase
MALNTEWGGFDRDLNVLPKTIFDEELDRDSVNPNDQHYEKRISGLYLGELLRRVLLSDLESATPCLSFKAAGDSPVHIAYSIDSSFLSQLAQDRSSDLRHAREKIAQDLRTSPVSVAEAEAVRSVAVAIGRRAARLSAIAIAGVVIQSERLSKPVSMTTTPRRRPAAFWTRCLARLQRLFSSLKALCRIQRRPPQVETLSKDGQSIDSDPPSEEDKPAQEEGIIDIGVDGSLFEFLPGFERELRNALRAIPQIGAGGEGRIRFGAVADGSGIGAALIVSAL